MTGERRNATVVARSEVLCLRLDKEDFREFILARPEMADEISRVLAERQVARDGRREGALGGALRVHQEAITRVMGVVVILLGLAFMGFLPGMTREYRFHRAPRIGIWSAPLLGALFGLGWTPCIGPTLAAVQTLAFTEGSALRGAVLSLAYCVGLGVPFVLLGLAFRRLAGTLSWVRGHYLLVMRIGGAMLIVIGLLLVTGLWSDLMILMRTWTGSFEVPL